jgi:HEAT repeat protein
VAVVSALQRLFFKRTFVTLRTALADPHDAVALHAATALEALHFPEAFDPLARIARDAESPRARAGALRAIARMNDAAAAEFLLGVLETGAPSDRAAAEAALRASTSLAFLAAARAASPTASRGLRPLLDDLLAGR